jgi:hypothetical protein
MAPLACAVDWAVPGGSRCAGGVAQHGRNSNAVILVATPGEAI